MSKLLIRIQSPDGMKRVELEANDKLSVLMEKCFSQFKIDPSQQNRFELYADRDRHIKIRGNPSTRVGDSLKHGDLIYLFESADSSKANNERTRTESEAFVGEEDEVDQLLDRQDGLVKRDRDEMLCHHGPQGKCINCVPVEPYDMDYLSKCDPPIKFMSFHAYLKKLKSGADKGKYTNLEILNCKIKPGCKEHPPWPKGICNKCQPNTVYLNRQHYRHVDNVMFENGEIVEKFLDYWRRCGCQRVGFLFGRYEPFDGAPLGIRAVVSAIYEPPQESTECSVELIWPDPNEEKVNNLAKKLGLKRVGWIFTDLISDETKKGTVKHFRGTSKNYFLTADECYTAGYLQNVYRNVTKYSSAGYFGSKFVTVVATGDEAHQIHFEAFQVSNQCVSLVRDKCIIPTVDAPELAYIKESSNEQYVPDVYFREKDQYGNEVTKIARPLPVDYLIIDLPAAFAKETMFTFNENSKHLKTRFPIENRKQIGELQNFEVLAKYMRQFPANSFLEAVSNFHLLLFLIIDNTVHFDNVIDPLLEAIKTKNARNAEKWAKTCAEYQTIEQFFPVDSPVASNKMYQDRWTCSSCTYINESEADRVCGVCSTPRQQ